MSCATNQVTTIALATSATSNARSKTRKERQRPPPSLVPCPPSASWAGLRLPAWKRPGSISTYSDDITRGSFYPKQDGRLHICSGSLLLCVVHGVLLAWRAWSPPQRVI